MAEDTGTAAAPATKEDDGDEGYSNVTISAYASARTLGAALSVLDSSISKGNTPDDEVEDVIQAARDLWAQLEPVVDEAEAASVTDVVRAVSRNSGARVTLN